MKQISITAIACLLWIAGAANAESPEPTFTPPKSDNAFIDKIICPPAGSKGKVEKIESNTNSNDKTVTHCRYSNNGELVGQDSFVGKAKHGMSFGFGFHHSFPRPKDNKPYLVSKFSYVNNMRHGPWVQYAQDAQGKVYTMVREFYNNGKKDGVFERFTVDKWKNYGLEESTTYKNDLKHGVESKYKESYSLKNTYLAKTTEYKDGKKNGVEKEFQISKKKPYLYSLVTYKDGLRDGVSETYRTDNDGNPYLGSKTHYKNDKLDGLSEEYRLDKAGKPYVSNKEMYSNGEEVKK